MASGTQSPTITLEALKRVAESTKKQPTIHFVDAPALGRCGIVALPPGRIDEMLEFGKRRSQAERQKLEPRKVLFRWVLLAHTLVNEQGQRLLSDDDILAPWLNDLPGETVMALYIVAYRVNGFDKD